MDAGSLDRARASLARAATRLPHPTAVARAGLGLTILLAGVHKLLAPAAWTVYVTDWLAPWLVVTPVAFMLANGAIEVLVGIGLLADRFTAVLAGVTAVSLAATVAYLALATLTGGASVADVAVRDLGLAALAVAVTLDAVGSGDRTKV